MLEYSDTLRLSAFLAVVAVMILWETLLPYSTGYDRTSSRWRNNLFISFINSLASRIIVPFSAIQIALWANSNSIGMLPKLISNQIVLVFVAVILLDLAIYLQHWAAHKFHWFWRLHRVHHSDIQFDVTTSVRFHPLEILLSLHIKAVVILLLGAPVEAVIFFEIVLSSMAVFNHANVELPAKVESWIRVVFVTPSMHRIHHSNDLKEHNSNYGFNLSIWDRIFSTYTQKPSTYPITIGLSRFQDEREISKVLGMLKIPFK